MKPTYSVISLLVGIILFSCQSKDTSAESATEEKPALRSLNNEELSKLYALTEKVDIIFYELPISVNQEDSASAKGSVLYISPAPVKQNPACKPMGRMSFIAMGSIYKEADFYTGNGCNYFVFIENNQPAAINAMQQQGIQFFDTLIKQVQSRMPQ